MPFLCATAAVAAGSAASSRWASKLQQLQQQQTPAEAAIAAADDVTAAAAESASDDELEAFDLHSSSSSSKAPRQLREVQMPALCSVRQLASLLGVQVSQLEEVFEEQLGEEVKSGGWVLLGVVGEVVVGCACAVAAGMCWVYK